jgi:hypothetical protein
MAVGMSGCAGSPSRLTSTTPVPAPATPSSAADCAASVRTAALPPWARAGFTPPGQAVPYVLGVEGDIVGVLFGQPLQAPPPSGDRKNKILWISRLASDGDALRIEARLTGSGQTTRREVAEGPGPSIIDLPAPGCWEFSLSWSGHRDQVYVPYAPR